MDINFFKDTNKFLQLSLAQWLAICLLFITSATAQADFYVIPVIKNSNTSIPIANVKDLGTALVSPGATEDVKELLPTSINNGAFTVPSGKYLVITSLHVFPSNPGSGTITLQLVQNSSIRKYWVLPNAAPSYLSFGSGLLIAPGYSLKIHNVSATHSFRVSIYGYLTDA